MKGYCTVCDWNLSTGDDLTETELSHEILRHYIETKHEPIETTAGPG